MNSVILPYKRIYFIVKIKIIAQLLYRWTRTKLHFVHKKVKQHHFVLELIYHLSKYVDIGISIIR